MNHIYRSIWSEALGTWIAVSELATGKHKTSSQTQTDVYVGSPSTPRSANKMGFVPQPILPIALLAACSNVYALPTGHELVAGQATVATPTATQMQINQGSDRAVINWQGFSVGQHEAVHIQQPNANAALLNRVVGQDASQIQGKIQANGQVYLSNPNGVIFSKTAQVDVGGLVATTHDIKNDDFMAGKNHFSQSRQGAKVENQGTINTTDGGVVALIGESVSNTGTINTPKGTTALAAGKTVDLDMKGDGLVEVKVSEAALNAQIENHGAITADGGRIVMTTKAANSLMDTVINQNGIVKARGMVERNGEIILEGGLVSQTGTLDVSGKTGGSVVMSGRSVLDAGKINADGTDGKGGSIKLTASHAIIQTAQADTHANGTTQGGSIQLDSQNSTFTSGKLSATGDTGGTINILSNNRVVLAAADVNASGNTQGGIVRVGGDFHGTNPTIKNAKTTTVNGATKIKADSGKGKVVVWSDEKTEYYGNISANKQGEIEVSSKGDLIYGGMADTGVGGSLLLDPQNIIISNSASVANFALIDPHLAAENNFGAQTVLLGTTVGGVYQLQSALGGSTICTGCQFTDNGKVVVTSPNDSFAASKAGAVHLFDTTTGALLATLTGSNANDQVGSYGVIALTNGNYVVQSGLWNGNRGAATWGNGLTGISGIVSSTNSLVSDTVNSYVGTTTALSNGNYVVRSANWSNGTMTNVGAATWGNGTIGVTGVISSSNSLVGSNSNDWVSNNAVLPLTNGNYVVVSNAWNSGTGAVTWGNGTTGITGVVSSANSLVGGKPGDYIGNLYNIKALTNGNYVVGSTFWSNSTIASAGAATWGNGLTGITGTISSTNSLIGSNLFDSVGGFIQPLSNGNYVVSSPNWTNRGAATFANGTTGITGFISSTNSLIGAVGDRIGWIITALTNGNYVVNSPSWNGEIGAATWGSGITGISGVISSTNSLVGSTVNDRVGQITVALANGNYVVNSPSWNSNRGAVTWGNGITGTSGVVNSTNSLVGSTANDQIGYTNNSSSVIPLTNGNYVVSSPYWNNNAGAATWGNGTTGITGFISSTNSLVGSVNSDFVSAMLYTDLSGTIVARTVITPLVNGNYVIGSSNWNNKRGAATWGNGTIGITGFISSTNSLIGSSVDDLVGASPVTVLTNGNYVIGTPSWDNGIIVNAGAVTWANGTTGITGFINSTNSLIGSTSNNEVGGSLSTYFLGRGFIPQNETVPLSDGNYVINSPKWDNGTAADVGAVTWGNGSKGTIGILSSMNSLTGAATGDAPTGRAYSDYYYYKNQSYDLNNGNYLVSSRTWDNNGLVDAGQIRIVTPKNIYFNNGIGQTMSFNPSLLSQTLAGSTDVILQANNDITLDVGTDIIVSGSAGGSLTLQAGRNITLNSSIYTANGNFTALAGDPNAIATDRLAGIPTITLGSGVTINAGTGKVLLAAINGSFNNYTGSISPITASQWFVYSADPRLNNRNGMISDFKHYGQPYTGVTPSYATTGNWFFYDVVPVLTVTPLPITAYGALPNNFPFIITGFLDGDTLETSGIFGSPIFGIKNITGNTYDINYLSGLFSRLGYVFTNDVNANNELILIEPERKTHLIDSNLLLSQISPLQTSTTFLPWYFSTFKNAQVDKNINNTPDSDIFVVDQNENFTGAPNPLLRFIFEYLDSEKSIIPVLQIKNTAGRIKRLELSRDRQHLSLLSEDNSIRIWDFSEGLQRWLDLPKTLFTDLSAVDKNGNFIGVTSEHDLAIYNIISSNSHHRINKAGITHFTQADDNSLFLINTGEYQLSLWDNNKRQERWQLNHQRGIIKNLAISPNKRYGAILSRQQGAYEINLKTQIKPLTDAVDIVDLGTGKLIKSLPNLGDQVVHLYFNNDNTLQLGLEDGRLFNWNVMTSDKKLLSDFSETIVGLDTIHDTYSYVTKNGLVRVGEDKNHIHLSIENPENSFKYAKLLDNGKKLLTVLADGNVSLWDIETGKKILRLFSSKQGWTVMDAFGRFDGSEEAMNNFSWLANEENIPLDNFSENYYEPGLLSSVLQNQDYLNNPDNVMDGIILPPKVDLHLAEQQHSSDKVKVQLNVYDRGGGIDKIHVYHNGKLIGDEEQLENHDDEQFSSNLTLTPTTGKNTVKVSASNDMGIENTSSEISFDGKTKAYNPEIRLLTVGINQYSTPKINLQYSVADANAIEQTLKTQAKVAINTHLIDDKATKTNILTELRKLSLGTEQDALVIYFAGHGIALGKEWYFLPHETKIPISNEQIVTTGISATELGDIFKNSKIQHIMLMVDACYSGAGVDAFKFKKQQNSQRYFARKMSRNLGMTIIAATAKDQQASELDSLGHGLFTYTLFQELENKTNNALTAHTLAAKLEKTLPTFSQKLLGTSQDPVIYSKGNDFMLIRKK